MVLNVLPGGACDRAGVQAGDRLVSMNGRQVGEDSVTEYNTQTYNIVQGILI